MWIVKQVNPSAELDPQDPDFYYKLQKEIQKL